MKIAAKEREEKLVSFGGQISSLVELLGEHGR
jgi:hypothetical protein